MKRVADIIKIAALSVIGVSIAGIIAVSAMPQAHATAFDDPAPIADDNSIAKEVLETVVYQDQEEAFSIKSLINEQRDRIALEAAAARASKSREATIITDSTNSDSVLGYTAVGDVAPSSGNDAIVDDSDIAEAIDEPLESTSHERVASPDEMTACQISINGDVLSWIDYYEAASAPAHGAGLWLGSDDVDDGSWGYFIGHNPGDFTAVMTLKAGDPITVRDRGGDTRTYYVVDSFDVKNTTYFSDISDKVCGYGESVIVQTCCGDNLHYRVVVAV